MTDILRTVRAQAYAGDLVSACDQAAAMGRNAENSLLHRIEALAAASEYALPVRGAGPALALAEEALALTDAPDLQPLAILAAIRCYLHQHTGDALDKADALLHSLPHNLAPHAKATQGKLQAIAHARRGHAMQALQAFAQAYDHALDEPDLRARVLLAWAVQLRNWGQFADAQRKIERSLELRLELGDRYGAALCYGVLAFVYQRQGDYERERAALAADIELCERMNATSDIASLHARLAGCLANLGKYAGAARYAESAVRLDHAGSTRASAFAERELARVALAQSRFDDAARHAAAAATRFAQFRDSYGEALVRLTQAEIELHRDPKRVRGVLEPALTAFATVGALPELATGQALWLRCTADASDATRFSATTLVLLETSGLRATPAYQTLREAIATLLPDDELERAHVAAASLRSACAIALVRGKVTACLVAKTLASEASARAFARAATAAGGLVVWPHLEIGIAIFPHHADPSAAHHAANQLFADFTDAWQAEGEVEIHALWPAGWRAQGEAIERALAQRASP